MMWSLLVALLACGRSEEPAPSSTPSAPTAPTGSTAVPVTGDTGPVVREVPWRPGLPPLERGLRAITHLHSPWSHDACDGDGLIDGEVNQPCLDDLRAGLCDAGIDVAFVTDHPSQAAFQPFDELFHPRAGDVREGDSSVFACDDGRSVRWHAGFEDELMPMALDEHVPGDAAERDVLLNRDDDEALTTMIAAGGLVFVAHSESRDRAQLASQQDAGLTGLEIFNLHAMFAPDIRADYLDLDPVLWLSDLEPFTDDEGEAEPDLMVLTVLADQPPSLAHFDALLARGPTVGIVGTDAHQNVFNFDLRDGDRADSYRRMLRWMANVLLPLDGESPEQALAAGRSFVAFEIVGTPSGFDLSAADGTPMGGSTTSTSLTVGCPTLHPDSPRGPDEPTITVRLLRDGLPFAEGCGEHEVTPGVYRVEVDIVPHHLRPFLGEVADTWIKPYPWIRSNAIRVTAD